MAKDMSKVYAEMLTKELVMLRKKHMATYQNEANLTSRKALQKALIARGLVEQIEKELADRVAAHNLFV